MFGLLGLLMAAEWARRFRYSCIISRHTLTSGMRSGMANERHPLGRILLCIRHMVGLDPYVEMPLLLHLSIACCRSNRVGRMTRLCLLGLEFQYVGVQKSSSNGGSLELQYLASVLIG